MDPHFVAAALIVFVARLLSGVTGFGFALVTVPPLMLFYDPARVVSTSILLALATGGLLLIGVSHHIETRTVIALLPSAAVGSLAGVALLAVLEANAIQALASAAVILFGIGHATGWVPTGVGGPGAVVVAGFASGALNTSVGMAGPPVVMLLTARRTPMHAFRATTIAYFLVAGAVGAAMLVGGRQLGRGDALFALALLPPTLLGLVASRWLVRRVSPEHFGRLTLGLLLATGLVGLIQALIVLVG